jgi:S-DNA-T family DNA segregation ATPase FtsK/SpoIIIE
MRTTTYSNHQLLPESARDFLSRRVAEFVGLLLICFCALLAVALMTWSVQDPSLNHATSAPTRNLLGPPGAIIADIIMQLFGLAASVLLVPIACWGWRLTSLRRLERPFLRILFWVVGSIAITAIVALFPVTEKWPLPTGLGGVLGCHSLSA